MTPTRALLLALALLGSTALASSALAEDAVASRAAVKTKKKAKAASAEKAPAEAAPAAEEQPAAALPDARRLLARFTELCGYEKLRETKNQYLAGTFSMPEQGMNAKMEAWTAVPNLIRVKITIDGIGETEEGFDGTNAWSVDPVQGPVIKDGEVAAQSAFDAEYFALIDSERFTEAKTLELVEFDGTSAYKVHLQPRVGSAITAWYAVESGLELAQETVHKTPMGEIPGTIRMFDYKDFNGMKFPTRMEQTMMGMKQIITIDSLTFDLDPAPDFSVPQAVQELLDDPEVEAPE